MKQKDIILIVVTIFISAVLSMIMSNIFISAPKNRQATVEVVTPIQSDFPDPDKNYFNDKAINPTQDIKIGDSTNKKPFNNKQ